MTLGLFQGLGIELEYMIVDRGSLAVRPLAGEVFRQRAGEYVGEWTEGAIGWSNELALHVLELKTAEPVPSLHGVAARFDESLTRLAAIVQAHGAKLLPGAMHPTMDPRREFARWTHDCGEIYAAYDRIFDCRGHGWSNLQSCHLNLPFADDAEFGRLHLAVRALLPLLPALAASSPFCEGRFTGWLDSRLEVYRHNQDRLPSITGLIVPEPVTSREQYYETILRPMWRDIAPFDPDGILQEEWLNSRGAVAKFFRDAIEIRVLDAQETPAADLAVCALVVEALKALVGERWCGPGALAALPTEELADVLWAVARDADQAVVAHPGLLAALGLPPRPVSAQAVWRQLADAVLPGADVPAELAGPLQTIIDRGPLGRRMLAAVGSQPDAAALQGLMGQLADCLGRGAVFG
jgi:gamma-glutamyl:cysteine ligase YbdK (ATP-grasp superfamily)